MSNLHRLYTPWGENLQEDNILNDYPRPQLQREQWINLNGRWKYCINKNKNDIPKIFDGEILVPFSPESILSKVERQLKPDEFLWYFKEIDFSNRDDKQVVLHFGAVDQIATLYVNGLEVGEHYGGYWPFSFNITSFLKNGSAEIVLRVKDFSNQGDSTYGQYAYGKQTLNRGGIWYTAQSGIWQTVWAEYLSESHIKSIHLVPDYDKGNISVTINPSNTVSKENYHILIFKKDELVAEHRTSMNKSIINLKDFQSWAPENPFLYDIVINSEKDSVKSYFGMRKFSIIHDDNRHPRIGLNNKPYFHNGLLDQGYWSDGMYTPPSDEAMVWEIKKLKELGYNMLRKHIKIEPLRWYYHCDRLGMLVWQDFVSGGGPYSPLVTQVLPFVGINIKDNIYGLFGRKDKVGKEIFKKEAEATMDLLKNVVSLAVWVPFNEGWGQFDSNKILAEVRETDPTRLVDSVSGWHDQKKGDFNSPHVYYKKFKMKKDKERRIQIISEFGGYSSPVPNNMTSDKLFGYKMFDNKELLTDAYIALYENEIIPKIKDGLSATVYTQVSDVEDEINGVFSYDRKIVKLDEAKIKNIHDRLKL